MLAIRIQIVGLMKVVERLKTYEERIGEEGEEQQVEQGKLLSANMDRQQTQHKNYGVSKGRGRGGCSNWRGRGHKRSGNYRNGSYEKGRDKERDNSRIQYYQCDKLRHYASDCTDILLKLQETIEKEGK